MNIILQINLTQASQRAKEYKQRIQPFLNIIQDIIETSAHPGYTIDVWEGEINLNPHPRQKDIDHHLHNIMEIQKEYPELFDQQDYLSKL